MRSKVVDGEFDGRMITADEVENVYMITRSEICGSDDNVRSGV